MGFLVELWESKSFGRVFVSMRVCSGFDFVGRRSLEVEGKKWQKRACPASSGCLVIAWEGGTWAAGRYTHVPNFQVQTRCMAAMVHGPWHCTALQFVR